MKFLNLHFFRLVGIAIQTDMCYNFLVIFKGVIVLQSIFHTEAPEKVRTLPDAAPAKSHKGEGVFGWICLILFFALLALLVLCCFDVYKNPENHYPNYTVNVQAQPEVPAEDPSAEGSASNGLQPVTALAANNGATGMNVPGADTIVGTSDDATLNNQQFIYYYWDNFYSLYEQMGSYLSSYLNFAVPFDQQQASQDQNWNQYLSTMAVETWYQTTVLCSEAEKNGFTPDDEMMAYLDSNLATLADYAAEAGYATTDEYLQFLFDPSSDMESYQEYNLQTLIASGYAQSMYDQLYEENYDPNAPVQYCVNVRHILIQPGEEEEMSAAQTRAQELYDQWLLDPTEDNFIALATEHTTDPGSQATGGLYQDVYPGQMVTNFNNWCFDESRQVGDTGIVETEYGYHIMYFAGNSEEIYSDGNAEAAQTAYTQWLDGLFASRQFDDLSANAVFTEKAK